MDNDQRQSWWPDEHSSNSHPAPRKESPLPEENLTEQHQEQQTFEEHSTEQHQGQQSRQEFQNWYQNQQIPNNAQNWNQNQNNFSNQRSRFPSGNGMVTASMIMGIISLLLICCGISYFFGALGIIFALLSRRDGPMESQAKVGLGLSIAGAVGGIILLVVTIVANFSTYQNLYQELEKYYLEDNYDEYEDFFDNYDNYLEEFNQNDSVHSDSGNSHVFLDL
ncbi:MAG: DUF4064 domain-containing protein [Eubacterium sp.]|nr:DUF4064 domain-containing protein [Eubacterium sp.]